MSEEVYFTVANSEERLLAAPTYQKKVLTHALRVHVPFTVETREGPLSCQDGYLVLDMDGWPYPVARDIFEKTYVLMDGRRFK